MDIRELQARPRDFRHHPWEIVRAETFSRMIVERSGSAPNIYDVGCGDAFFASLVARAQPQACLVGVDTALDASMMETLQAHYHCSNLKLFSSLEPALAEGRTADWVLLMDVIEHIEDDLGFLRHLVSQVPGNPRYLVAVPAFPVLFSQHDRWLGHYRRYSLERLTTTLKTAGLQIEQSGYLWSTLLIPRALQKLAELLKLGQKARPSALVSWGGPLWFDGLVRNVLRLDARACIRLSRRGLHLPGLTTYAIASRSKIG